MKSASLYVTAVCAQLLANEIGNGNDIIHDHLGLLEDRFIDLLQHVFSAARKCQKPSSVDVTDIADLDLIDRLVNKMREYLSNLIIHVL
jgi:hypothetical protein